ncbi:MAG: pentapeptide repeat-containing protein [Hymenobacteraceae bacterium]|nr:pentapeptide repeat-containing protein [Hymenobacteraceae bacterium]
MKASRKPIPLQPPTKFSAANVLTGLDAEQVRALGPVLETYHFVGCDLNAASLARLRFVDCLFDRCDLSNVNLSGTGLQNVAFTECKLLGVSFTGCQELLFGVHFDRCLLRYASFGGRKMVGTRFERCGLPEADFTNADLTGAVFAECDLTRAVFHDTRLVDADFRTATGYSLDPEANQLTGARFALAGLPGLLEKYGVVVE